MLNVQISFHLDARFAIDPARFILDCFQLVLAKDIMETVRSCSFLTDLLTPFLNPLFRDIRLL